MEEHNELLRKRRKTYRRIQLGIFGISVGTLLVSQIAVLQGDYLNAIPPALWVLAGLKLWELFGGKPI